MTIPLATLRFATAPRQRSLATAKAMAFAAAACQSNEPTIEPMSLHEREQLAALRHYDPKSARLEDKGTLFVTLDQNLRKWRELGVRTEIADIDQRTSLEVVMTRQVYYNFDTILNELQHGTDPEHRVTAAAALGFSRIPAPDQPGGDPSFPVVHTRAVAPLLAALESPQTELVENALLSIGRIGAPETPRALLVELMVQHHNADVRANAALALAQVATPEDAPLIMGPLFSALGDVSPMVRLHAVKALGKLQDNEVRAALVDRLRRDDTPLVRACAALELGKIGDAGTVSYLIEGLQSEAQLVAFQCHQALVRITKKTDLRGYVSWRDWWDNSPANPGKASKT